MTTGVARWIVIPPYTLVYGLKLWGGWWPELATDYELCLKLFWETPTTCLYGRHQKWGVPGPGFSKIFTCFIDIYHALPAIFDFVPHPKYSLRKTIISETFQTFLAPG